MKLYLNDKDKDGNRIYYDVNFWSFMKCFFLVCITLGMIYTAILIIGAIFYNIG